jgi:hypothetical protein
MLAARRGEREPAPRTHAAAASGGGLFANLLRYCRASLPSRLGANTGEFSMLAAHAGARVLAVDGDHHCIEKLYLDARGQPKLEAAIHAVVARLDDPCARRGWNGSEAPGIGSRLRGHSDVAMMLGLVHHLAITCAIPMVEVAAFAADMTRSAATHACDVPPAMGTKEVPFFIAARGPEVAHRVPRLNLDLLPNTAELARAR